MKERYAIQVIDRLAEIRDLKICKILDLEYTPRINEKSYFIGYGNKNAKFLNWYENHDYIKTWDSKEEAESFLENLLREAKNNYNTKKDPFYHLLKTKGDWKCFGFAIAKIK
jgi:hypothetical protein